MGLRFRKRISLGGLVHLNLSRTGVSLNVGPKGANVNVGGLGPNRKPKATIGLPGSGLYYTQTLGEGRKPSARENSFVASFMAVIVFGFVAFWLLRALFGM